MCYFLKGNNLKAFKMIENINRVIEGQMESSDPVYRQSCLYALNISVSALASFTPLFHFYAFYNRVEVLIYAYYTIQAFWCPIQSLIASSIAILMLPFFIPSRVFTSFLNCLSNSSSIVRMIRVIHNKWYLCIYKLMLLCDRYLSI
jgi:hypothetical protein